MKKAVLGVILAAVCFCQQAQAQTLTWDLKFLQGKAKESVPMSLQFRMEVGDYFQLTIIPASDCYCYVICYDSDRQISVIKNEYVKGETEIYLDTIYITVTPETKTVYVIMSLEKQTSLENLIQAYNNNSNSQQNANNLYRELVNLQDIASGLGEPASSFIPSAGTSRGGEVYVNRYSGMNFYVRPILIRH